MIEGEYEEVDIIMQLALHTSGVSGSFKVMVLEGSMPGLYVPIFQAKW